MNTTFWIWLVGAGAVALAFLLLLGAPGGEPAAVADAQVGEAVATGTTSTYWRPVEPAAAQSVPTAVQSVRSSGSSATTCAPCAVARSPELVGGCGIPASACAQVPCSSCGWTSYDVCADPCRLVKPGINRNMPLCVDECSFVQLHSTVGHPLCGQVRFAWSASKGRFLDPSASDPLFFAPATQFCEGEDLWITLVVTDACGAQYSDVVTLHIRDVF